jgi:hypothetical protein
VSDLSDDELHLMSTVDYRERLLEVCAKSGNFHGAVVRPESQQLILYGVGRPSPDLRGSAAHRRPWRDVLRARLLLVRRRPARTTGPGGGLGAEYPVTVRRGLPVAF